MSNYKDIFKHSKNYLFANIATKALGFISIPIYTRLLSKEEYGIFNVFIASVGVFSVLFTLNTETAISRYFYDKKDDTDFKKFVGTIIRLCFFVLIITSFLFFMFLTTISNILSFEKLLTVALLPVSLYYIINSIFTQIYNPLLQSKKIAIVSSIQAYLAFGLSVVFIILLPTKKYYGLVLGTILAMFCLSIYLYKQIKPFYTKCFDKKFIKYSLNYTLPYIPYTISGVLLAQFGRIVISKYGGFVDAGLYSFAANIGSLMLILISVTHQAWNPYYFQQMNDRNYEGINKDYDLIWRITLFCSVFISMFGYELGCILNKSYKESFYLIPVFVVGYVFYQWSYVYMRNAGYAKKTIWNAVAVFTSGTFNIVLSIILVKKIGILGVAISFMLSYVVLLFVSWLINKKKLHIYSTSFKSFARVFVITIPFFIISQYFYFIPNDCYVLSFFIKVIVSVFYAFIILKKYKQQIAKILSNK